MKKYKLRLKKEFSNEPLRVSDFIDVRMNNGEYIWLKRSYTGNKKYSYHMQEEHALNIDEDELGSLPYRFVKMHDIIEVKEQLYYIRVPYVTGYECYINEHRDKHLIIVSDKYGHSGYKTKFTKQEIEDKFPEYANNTFMVKVEYVE